jgi:hypothetical protein
MIKLWEILVPTVRPDGRPIKARFHRVWDRKVYEITNGLTILTPTKGKWVNTDGVLFAERMIPVRIACTHEQIESIIDFSLTYYEQEAIMAYLLSETVIIKHK